MTTNGRKRITESVSRALCFWATVCKRNVNSLRWTWAFLAGFSFYLLSEISDTYSELTAKILSWFRIFQLYRWVYSRDLLCQVFFCSNDWRLREKGRNLLGFFYHCLCLIFLCRITLSSLWSLFVRLSSNSCQGVCHWQAGVCVRTAVISRVVESKDNVLEL